MTSCNIGCPFPRDAPCHRIIWLDVIDDLNVPLPPLALSVRQPWAWAIIYGGKVIENRSLSAIRAGGMTPGRICIHAATGMTRSEYRWGDWRLDKHGVYCPAPSELPRGAIIGTVEVIEIITESDSEWFGGQAGLRLANPKAIVPVPAQGALGYFTWKEAADFARILPWMSKHDRDAAAASLFEDLPVQFASEPLKPFGAKALRPKLKE